MKRLIPGVLLMFVFFLISCTPQVSDEEIFLRLEDLSDEELDAALADDNAALAGKAFSYGFSTESSNKVRAVRQQMRPLTWLSCSTTDTSVNVQYADNGIKSRTFVNSCSENQLQKYTCSGNKYLRETITCENGCLDGKCLGLLSKYTPVKNGLVAWWDGDDVSENIAADLIGNNDGAMTNGATTAFGKIGEAFSFDGEDDYVNIFFPSYLSEFTIEAWVYLDLDISETSLGVPGSGNPTIIAQSGPVTWSLTYDIATHNLFFKYNDGSSINIIAAFGSTPQSISPPGIPLMVPKIWRHVAVTYKSGLVDLYLNGMKTNRIGINKKQLSPTNGFQPIIKIGGGVMVDPNDVGNTPPNWPGLIDEVKLYARVLTPTEIHDIYNYQPPREIKPEVANVFVQN